MHSFTSTLTSLVSLLALTSAAPATKRTDVPCVEVTFHGATPQAFYTVPVPLDGVSEVFTDNALSISSVSYNIDDVECCLYGIDSDKAKAAMPRIANWGQVGPPQTIISITCKKVY